MLGYGQLGLKMGIRESTEIEKNTNISVKVQRLKKNTQIFLKYQLWFNASSPPCASTIYIFFSLRALHAI